MVTRRAGKGSSVINALIALDKLLLYRQVLLRVLLESTRMLERTRKLLISQGTEDRGSKIIGHDYSNSIRGEFFENSV